MNKIKGLRSSPLLLSLLSALILLVFLLFTEPLELPLLILLVPFVLFFVCIRNTFLVVLQKLYHRGSKRKVRLLATSGATILVFIIILQSLGQLSWRDILLTISLIAAAAVYFNKTDLL